MMSIKTAGARANIVPDRCYHLEDNKWANMVRLDTRLGSLVSLQAFSMWVLCDQGPITTFQYCLQVYSVKPLKHQSSALVAFK